jgi:hypothetical protein
MVTIVLLPAQDYDEYFPPIAGFSILFVAFSTLTGYVLLNRINALAKVWRHPLFCATYTLLGLGFLIESLHPPSSYIETIRIGQMVAGAVMVACLCRDRQALRLSIFGFLIAGIWVSVFVFLRSYGVLYVADVTNFSEATWVRSEVFGQMPRGTNPNTLATFCVLGSVVALGLALTTSLPYRRYLLLGISLFCLVANFLTLSRSGAVIVIISSTAIIFASEVRWYKTVPLAGAMVVIVMIWVPHAVWSRMAFSTQADEDRQEGRARVYTTSIKTLPEYWMIGVGAERFYKFWALENGFQGTGSHNCFIQVTIYWGLLGLLALVAIIWQAYRCLPKRYGDDAMALCLLGIAISLFLLMQVMHNLYIKELSLGLGILVGTHQWVWAKGRGIIGIIRAKAPIA